MNTSILSISIFAPMENRQLLDLTMRRGIAVVAGGAIGLDRYPIANLLALEPTCWCVWKAALFTLVPFAVGDFADISSLTRII